MGKYILRIFVMTALKHGCPLIKWDVLRNLVFFKSHSFRGFPNTFEHFKPASTGSHMPVMRRAHASLFLFAGKQTHSLITGLPCSSWTRLSGLLVPFTVCSGQMSYELGCPNLAAGKTKEQRSHQANTFRAGWGRDCPFGPDNSPVLILIRIANGSVGTIECV